MQLLNICLPQANNHAQAQTQTLCIELHFSDLDNGFKMGAIPFEMIISDATFAKQYIYTTHNIQYLILQCCTNKNQIDPADTTNTEWNRMKCLSEKYADFLWFQ